MTHKLYRKIDKILKEIGMNFIEIKALSLVSSTIDVLKHVKVINDVYFGPHAVDITKEMSTDDINEVHEVCLKFYLKSFEEMRKRFLEHVYLLKPLIFVEPSIALSLEKREKEYRDLFCLQPFFPFINFVLVSFKCRKLLLHFEENEQKILLKLEVENFWIKIFSLKVNNELCFQN